MALVHDRRRRHDVAIYAPNAFLFYEDPASSRVDRTRGGGGAELQTSLIASSLAGAGFRVAHIVFPVTCPLPGAPGRPTVVQRPRHSERRRPWYGLTEIWRVWLAMARADAGTYVFRGGGKQLGVAATFCLLRSRRLVFSGSNDLDFMISKRVGTWLGRTAYRFALRQCSAVVVQTDQQAELAHGVVGDKVPISVIPSFAQPAGAAGASRKPAAFLWAGRMVDYKLPLEYVKLARALPGARFRMVTARTNETSDELEGRIVAEGSSLANLELLSTLARAELLDLISEATAVVLTSRLEGMPNVFLEAWARGVPVLSLHFDPDGVISAHGLGLFAEGSWDDFVEGARRLWSDDDLRAGIAAAARRYVAETHSLAAVGSRWVDVLGDAAGVRPSPSR